MEKRLYRSRTDRMLAGVAGGLGEYLAIDPTLVRIAFVVLAVWGGVGVPLYILLWLVVPEAPPTATAPAGASTPEAADVGVAASGAPPEAPASAPGAGRPRSSSEPAVIIGAALIAVGGLILLRNLGFMWVQWLDARVTGPAVLIAIGLFLLLRKTSGNHDG